LLEETDGDVEGGGKKDGGAEDPHDDGACVLVGEGGDAEGVGFAEVVAVDRLVAEGEEGRECGVNEVGGEEVEDHEPAGVLGFGGPGADEGVPEEEGGEEEAGVFDLVPVFVFEGEVVRAGDVPAEEEEVHGEPGDDGGGEGVAEAAEGAGADEGAEDVDADGAGEAAEERDDGCSGEEERGDDGHEEEVLDHVGGEECVGESVHGGADGDPDDGEAGEEGGDAPVGELVAAGAADEDPAAGVDDGREDEGDCQEEREVPVVEYGLDGGGHGFSLTVGWGVCGIGVGFVCDVWWAGS
jgi:hypothetical protein